MISESLLIGKIRRFLPAAQGIRKGIGDDAAVLPLDKKHYLLLTVDTIVDGVDFRLTETSPELVGRKALAINLSDIAAMGGEPCHALVALGIPAGLSYAWIRRFYSGMRKLGKEFNTVVVGGDLSRSKQFFASVTVAGKVKKDKLVLRDGAKTGDSILVTGRLGGSLAGRHLTFTPRVREAAYLVKHFKINAMMDLSDGLMRDLDVLMRESKKGARVFMDSIPVSQTALRGSGQGKTNPLKSALCDGEDFELLFTASRADAKNILAGRDGLLGTPVRCIGKATAGQGIMFQKNEKDREKFKLPWKGYEHF